MTDAPFAEFEADLDSRGAEAALEKLSKRLRDDADYHGLFDVRLMQARRQLGLPVILATPLEDLAEPLRGAVEAAYLEACREAGWLLWQAGKLREAWVYLRPLGENAAVADALRPIEPTDDNFQTLIEIGLQEGVAPAHGFRLVLDRYGTCNAITTFDSEMPRHSRGQQQLAAGHLVRQIHADLLTNLQSDIARREPAAPDQASALGSQAANGPALVHVPDLIGGRDWLFAENSYHVNTSHLSAILRIARIVEDREILELAWELAEYGRHLSATFQQIGNAPFEDVYVAHGLFFAAQLGRQVEEATAYFRGKAEQANPAEDDSAAAEVYVVLLIRLGRTAEALTEHIRLIPAEAREVGFAPTVLELARMAGDYDQLLSLCRLRGDLLGFAAGLLSKADADRAAK